MREIEERLKRLPGADKASAAAAEARQARLTKPPGSLGRLEDLAAWLASWQGRHPPRLDRVRIAVFAGNQATGVNFSCLRSSVSDSAAAPALRAPR